MVECQIVDKASLNTLKNKIFIEEKKNIVFSYILFSQLLFIIFPVSVVFQIAVLFFSNQRNKIFFYNLAISLSLLLGLINITKIPESDMKRYVDWFYTAQEMNFFDYIFAFTAEPVYHVLAFSLHELFGGNLSLFIFSFTAIVYSIFLTALLTLCFSAKLPSRVILGFLVFGAFFPQLFSLSMHLNRQFLAGVLLFFFFTESLVKDKKRWLIFVTAGFTHTTAWFFLPFVLLPIFRERMKPSIFVAGIIVFSAFIFTLPFLGKFLGGTDVAFLSYTGRRMAQEEYFELGSIGFLPIVLIISNILIIQYKFFLSRTLPSDISGRNFSSFGMAFLVVGLFILLSSLNPATVELSLRFLFYIYFLMFISLVIVLHKNRFSVLTIPVFIFLIPVYFFINLEVGIWEYQNYGVVLLQPIFFSL